MSVYSLGFGARVLGFGFRLSGAQGEPWPSFLGNFAGIMLMLEA